MEHQPAFTNYETGRDVSGNKVPTVGPTKDGGCEGGNLFKIPETVNNNVFAACEHVVFFLQSDFVLF